MRYQDYLKLRYSTEDERREERRSAAEESSRLALEKVSRQQPLGPTIRAFASAMANYIAETKPRKTGSLITARDDLYCVCGRYKTAHTEQFEECAERYEPDGSRRGRPR